MAYEPTVHRRSCLGLVLAALVGTIVFNLMLTAGLLVSGARPERWVDIPLELLGFIFLSALLGAGPATVLVGLPVYFLLRGRVRATPFNCGVLGALIGAVPLAVWGLGDGGFGWMDAGGLGLCAIAGLVGGLVFWKMASTEINEDFESRRSEKAGP